MGKSRQAADPVWKQLLRLGEELIEQPTPADQCDRIVDVIGHLFSAKVCVWLASPAYPLPGNAEIVTLPEASATPLVHQAAADKESRYRTAPTAGERPVKKAAHRRGFLEMAIPLKVDDVILGVVQVERPDGPPFSEHEFSLLEGFVRHAAIAMETTRQETLKNWRFEQLRLVQSVSAQIASLTSLDELYRRVTQLIQQTFHLYYVAIFTLDEEQAVVRFRGSASENQSMPLRSDFWVHLGDGMVGAAAESGTEIVAQDVHKENHYLYMDLLPETRSEASFPLKVENRILGVLDVQSDRAGAFHESDILVLRALANNIALAIESTHLYDNLQSRADQVSSVFEVSHALTSILNLDDLLDEVVRLIQNRFGYPFVHVYTVHPGRRLVIYQVGTGERSEAMKQQGRNFPLDAPQGLISWVARTGKTYLANDVTLEPLYLPADLPPYDTRSELTVPLATSGEVLGVLDIQSQKPGAFDDNDRSLFEALAAPIAIAMRNANLYRSEQWRRRVAESFRDVANLITASLPVNELLDFILHKLHDVLPCDASAIWLLQEESISEASGQITAGASRLRLGATLNIDPAKVLEVLQQEPVLQILNRALESEQPFIRKLDDPSGPLGTALGFQSSYSSIAAPMRVGKRTLGLLTLVHHQNGRYGSEAQAITATFASYAAVALQNTRLYREAQEQALVSTMLLQVAEASQSIVTVQELLSTMIRITRLLMGVKKCAFLLWEDSLQSFSLKAWYGIEPAGEGGGPVEQRFSASLPALSRLSTQRSIYYLDDPGIELNFPEMRLEPGKGTVIMLPMLVRGELSGALLVGLQTGSIEEQGTGFDPKALAILQGIAHQTSITIDNMQLLEARQEEAYVTAALLQVAQAVVTSSDLNDTLDTIVHLLPILVGIETCAIYLWDAASQVFRPTQVSGRSRREEETILAHPFAPGENRLLDAIHQSGIPHMCPIITPELPFEEWGNLDCQPYEQGSGPPTTAHTDWVLAYPLILQGQVMGILMVREMNALPSFWERRLEIIHGIAQQASMAIQNDIMRQELVQTERIEREIQLARQIQETFLPDTLPSLPHWELDIRWETAREIGGDFYDYFKLDDQRIGLVIADVADKGLPAALYMTVTRTLIRASANDRSSPAKVLEDVNRLLLNDSSESMFVTAVYIILSLETGELTYANAGHNRPLLYRLNTRSVEQLPKGGTALGILDDPRLENHSLTLAPGDALVLSTDGVTDITAPDGSFFGQARLEELVQAHGGEIIQNMLEELDDAMIEFRRGVPPSDDITVLAVRREPVKRRRRKKTEGG